MEKTSQIKPAINFGPGYFIKEQMETREWTQEDLAEITGITLKHISRILLDKQPITLDTARLLAEVFKTSAQYWLNLDTSYRLWLEHEKTAQESEANELAAEKLMHNEIAAFLIPYLNYLTVNRVEECASRYEVHPSVVIGKLAFDKDLSYKNLYLFNENVLELIPERFRQ